MEGRLNLLKKTQILGLFLKKKVQKKIEAQNAPNVRTFKEKQQAENPWRLTLYCTSSDVPAVSRHIQLCYISLEARTEVEQVFWFWEILQCSAQVVLRGNHCHHWHGDRCDDRCQRRCGVAHADLRSLLFLFILADLLSVYYQILVIYILPAMVW